MKRQIHSFYSKPEQAGESCKVQRYTLHFLVIESFVHMGLRELMMRKRSPTHPGAILREDVLPSLAGMSVSAFARSLGVSRQTLHAVLAERSGVSTEMALRLGALLGNGAQGGEQ